MDILRELENKATGLRFELVAVEARRLFLVRRYHTEPVGDSKFAAAFALNEVSVEDEEVVLYDYFEANDLYNRWLLEY